MEAPVTAKTALLQELARGPGYGLDLVARIREATGGALALSDGSVYPALRALEAAGLVESAGVESRGDRGGRPRQLYRITDAGAAEAERQRAVMAAIIGMGCPPAEQRRAPERSIEPAQAAKDAAEAPAERWVEPDE